MAEKVEAGYIETSALTVDNIQEAFEQIGRGCYYPFHFPQRSTRFTEQH
jgi:hypothetical protein